MIGWILLASAQTASGDTASKQAYDQAFEKSFRTSFRASSISGCVASAKQAKAAHVDVTAICGCVADRLLAARSTAQLRQHIDPEELKPIVSECVRSHPPQAGSTP